MGGPDGSLALAVVDAIAEREGVDPTDLDVPLYDAIDPDALENLFPVDAGGRPRCRGHVTFAYGTHCVRVTSDREVRVVESPEADADVPAGGDDQG